MKSERVEKSRRKFQAREKRKNKCVNKKEMNNEIKA